MAKQRPTNDVRPASTNQSQQTNVASQPTGSDFDKFLTSALDNVVTTIPGETGTANDTVLSNVKSGVINNPTDFVPAAPEPDIQEYAAQQKQIAQNISKQLRSEVIGTVQPPVVHRTPDQAYLNSHQAMLREEEARIAARNGESVQQNPYQQSPQQQQQAVPNVEQQQQMVQINQHKAVADIRNMEDQVQESFRAGLRQEEERLAKQQPIRSAVTLPHANRPEGVAFTLHSAKEPVIREDANKITVEAYMLLRRLVAGQYIMPSGLIYQETLTMLDKLKNEVEVTSKESA